MTISKKKAEEKVLLGERSSTSIHRHSAPTIYDQLECGSKIVVANKYIYIQTSQDENSPCWELMGEYKPSPAL